MEGFNIKLLLHLWVMCGIIIADHEHGESREHAIHMSNNRISRWHVHHRIPIPVHKMRMDCMGSHIEVIDLTMILTGSVCHTNHSAAYLNKLRREMENCSADDECLDVKWDNSELNITDCMKHMYIPTYFCSTYLQQYSKQCMQFFISEMVYTNEITALDIEVKCLVNTERKVDYSIITLLDKQPLDIGHLINKCKSRNPNNFLQIVGFVETAEQCPSDRYVYTPPDRHPLVETLQRYANNSEPVINFEDFHNNLSMRLMCGNVIFPVVYDGLITLSKAHGWIYYSCGTPGGIYYKWDGHWINLTREKFNGTHLISSEMSIYRHCHGSQRLTIAFLIILLALALCCEVFTLYRRDEILTYLKNGPRAWNKNVRIGVNKALARSSRHSGEQTEGPKANSTTIYHNSLTAVYHTHNPAEPNNGEPLTELSIAAYPLSQKTSTTSVSTNASTRPLIAPPAPKSTTANILR